MSSYIVYVGCLILLICIVDIIGDIILHMQGFGMLSMAAASAAHSAANVVQAGTKEITSKVVWSLFTGILIENLKLLQEIANETFM